MTEATAHDSGQAGAVEPHEATALQKLTAELIGTFILVLVGCGTLAFFGSGPGINVAFAFGLTLIALIYAFGRISGGHFNPAVSVGAAIGGRLGWRQAGTYVAAQAVGAVLAGVTLLILALGFDGFDAFEDSLGANYWGDASGGYAWWATIVLEILITAALVFVVFAVTDRRAEHPVAAPAAIGLTYAGLVFFALAADGGSANPARSLGPALFSGGDALKQLPIFLLAPLVGAVIAGLLYPAVFGRDRALVSGSGLILPKKPAKKAKATSADQGRYASAGQTGTAQPIIQDGWQWDPAAQQWIPAQQPPASEPASDRTQARPGTD